MHSILSTTSQAADLHILTTAQMRAAVGVSDGSQDAALAELELRVVAAVTSECSIAQGDKPATLRRETLTETFRHVRNARALVLSRRHGVSIASVTVDGTTLSAGDYEIDPEAGIAYRVSGGQNAFWCADKIVVVYDAGFPDDAMPGDLIQAVMEFMRLIWIEKNHDPSLKSEVIDIPNVQRIERAYWVGAVPGQASPSAVPDIVAGQLERYRNAAVA